MSNLTERVQYVPPWQTTNWGLSFRPLHHLFNLFDELDWGPMQMGGRACDEWGNKSIYVIVPLVGQFVWFTGRNLWGKPFSRDGWHHGGYRDGNSIWVSPDFELTATLPHPDELLAADATLDVVEDDDFVLVAPQSEQFVRRHALRIEPL